MKFVLLELNVSLDSDLLGYDPLYSYIGLYRQLGRKVITQTHRREKGGGAQSEPIGIPSRFIIP
jgi:hypothetical protein